MLMRAKASSKAKWFWKKAKSKEGAVVFLGIAVTLAGFLIAVSGLGAAAAVGGRMILTLLGIAVSITGIIGVINRVYLRNAIWKR